jgi:Plasmid pRiA4b ORF-3-like protein
MLQSSAPAEVYQLHILLLQINPPIWRRLHVRSDSSIATLHELLQIVFDWSDFHSIASQTLRGHNRQQAPTFLPVSI